MAIKKPTILELPPETIIEVIAQKDQKYYKSTMSFAQWKAMKRKPEFVYRAFQLGFSQFKTEN